MTAHAKLQLPGRGGDGQGPGRIRRCCRVRRCWKLVCFDAATKVCRWSRESRAPLTNSGVSKLLLIDVS